MMAITSNDLGNWAKAFSIKLLTGSFDR